MEYYGFINFMLAPGTWNGFEQTQLLPIGEEKGRRTGHGAYSKSTRLCGFEGAHATWPIARLTRQIFAFDEPGGGSVWIVADERQLLGALGKVLPSQRRRDIRSLACGTYEILAIF